MGKVEKLVARARLRLDEGLAHGTRRAVADRDT